MERDRLIAIIESRLCPLSTDGGYVKTHNHYITAGACAYCDETPATIAYRLGLS